MQPSPAPVSGDERIQELRRLPEDAPALPPARTRRCGGRAPARPRSLAPGMHAIRPFPPDRVGAASWRCSACRATSRRPRGRVRRGSRTRMACPWRRAPPRERPADRHHHLRPLVARAAADQAHQPRPRRAADQAGLREGVAVHVRAGAGLRHRGPRGHPRAALVHAHPLRDPWRAAARGAPSPATAARTPGRASPQPWSRRRAE